MQADQRMLRRLRDQGGPHIGVAADKRGVVGPDHLDAAIVDDPDQLGELRQVGAMRKGRPAGNHNPETNFHS